MRGCGETPFVGAHIMLMWLAIFFLASCASAAHRTILSALLQPKFKNPLNIPPTITPGFYGIVNITMVETNLSLGLYATDGTTKINTTVWAYNGISPGPTIVAQSNSPVVVIWHNALPTRHLLKQALDPKVDCGPRIHLGVYNGTNDCSAPEVRTVVHLHGARVGADYDGYPDAWWDHSGGQIHHGASHDGHRPFSGTVYTYPNGQEAATLWYHDHSVGTTRLNVYAGMAGFYILHDDWEKSLPLPQGAYDIPIMIRDGNFTPSGKLQYPHSTHTTGEPLLFNFGLPLMPFILVNGGIWPYLDVQPTKYRIRLLNACDTRFLNLSLSHNVPTWKIGADQGLLDTPIAMDLTDYSAQNLFFGPGQRHEIILDFTNFAGQNVTLLNGGDWEFNDGGTTEYDEDLLTAGLIMQFRVSEETSDSTQSFAVPQQLRQTPFDVPVTPNKQTRFKGISVGNNPMNDNAAMLVLGQWNNTIADTTVDWTFIPRMWDDPVSDFEATGVTSDWYICKTGGAIHPVHIHWLSFKVIARYQFTDKVGSDGTGSGVGSELPLLIDDYGPKDIVLAFPDQCVQVRLLFGEVGRYIWHCHILSHEDLDMMRPLVIVPTLEEADAQIEAALSQTHAILLTNESAIEMEMMNLRLHVDELHLTDDYDDSEPILALEVLPTGPYASVSRYLNLHAVLMAIGFGLLLPLGLTWARHCKSEQGIYAFLPLVVHVFGLIFILIAFIIGFTKLATGMDNHWIHVHRAIGITVFTFVWLSPFSGALRDRLRNSKTRFNYIVVKLHNWCVLVTLVLAFIQIPIGIYIMGASSTYTIAYIILMVIMISSVLFAELHFGWQDKKKSNGDILLTTASASEKAYT